MLSLCLEQPVPSVYLAIFSFKTQLGRPLLLEAFPDPQLGRGPVHVSTMFSLYLSGDLVPQLDCLCPDDRSHILSLQLQTDAQCLAQSIC